MKNRLPQSAHTAFSLRVTYPTILSHAILFLGGTKAKRKPFPWVWHGFSQFAVAKRKFPKRHQKTKNLCHAAKALPFALNLLVKSSRVFCFLLLVMHRRLWSLKWRVPTLAVPLLVCSRQLSFSHTEKKEVEEETEKKGEKERKAKPHLDWTFETRGINQSPDPSEPPAGLLFFICGFCVFFGVCFCREWKRNSPTPPYFRWWAVARTCFCWCWLTGAPGVRAPKLFIPKSLAHLSRLFFWRRRERERERREKERETKEKREKRREKRLVVLQQEK